MSRHLLGVKTRQCQKLQGLYRAPYTEDDQSQWRTMEFCSGGGGSTNSVEDRGENGDLGGGSPLVRGSGGSCNLVQEISFHIVKFY